jgi:hypothetical protein
LVAIAVYQICKAYKDVIESNEDADPSIVLLTEILLKDFDPFYTPADDTGKVKYFQDDALGHGNRYLGIHQYFMFASLLDPRVLPILSHIMTEADFQLLKKDIIDLMVAKAKKANLSRNTKSTPPTKSLPDAKSHCFGQKAKQSHIRAKMFSGLSTQRTFDNNSDDDDNIHHTTKWSICCKSCP